jgi:hypothetical protein
MEMAMQSLLLLDDVILNAYSVSHPTPPPYYNHIDILTMILFVIFLVSILLNIAKLINQCIQNCGGGGSEIDQLMVMMQPGGNEIDQHMKLM